MARKKNLSEMEDDEGREEDFDYGEEPDFNDPEDFEEDITDEELMPEIMRMQPKESDGVDSVIVVDNVPVVEGSRVDKLKNVIRKIYSKFGKLMNEHYPLDDEGKTKGYIFLEFNNHPNALEAVKQTNNYKLDKQHTFQVNLFSDFEKYESIPDVWEPPKPSEYKDQGNLKSWLLDQDANDQYSVIHKGGEEVTIFSNNNPEAVEIQTRPRWTETYVKWSPLGTLLATFHTRGIALWGGEDFHQISKFAHPGVQYIEFSPCEKYLVTFSPSASSVSSDEPTAIIIWDARTGIKKRAFHSDNPPVWPVFKWSQDDKYFVRMTDNTLSIYETPSFGLLDKKSIKVEGLQGYSWSPRDNILAYWVAEDKDVPARVVLMEVPSRNELRVKNLFNVADCKMHWQKCGDYLCVMVNRYKKILTDNADRKYAGLYYNFEVFHMLEKQIPVDTVKIEETVHAFSWEPVGTKFAIVHGDSQSNNVSFYRVQKGLQQPPELLKKYERKTANCLFWCPTGQFVILAGMRGMNGVLEFVDTADFTSMGGGEHFMCTDVEWDPTGRYVMTGVSWWGHKVDNAFWLWNFQGKILKRSSVEKFCQLVWRPRPPTLLPKEQIKELKKNLKKYSVKFTQRDNQRSNKASAELAAARQKLMADFSRWKEGKEEEYAMNRDKRMDLRRGIDTDHDEGDQFEEETVEFLIKEDETIIQE